MTVKTFLIVNSRGATRTAVNRPNLKMDEIALGLTIELPQSLFERPQLEATITVSPEAAQRPTLSAEAIDAVKQSIEQGAGMEVTIRVIEPEANV